MTDSPDSAGASPLGTRRPAREAPDQLYRTLTDFGDFTLEDLHHQLSVATVDLLTAEAMIEKDARKVREYLVTGRRGCDIAGRMLEHMIALGGRRLRRVADPDPGIIVTGRGGPMNQLPIIFSSRKHRLWNVGARLVETAPGDAMPQLELGSDRTGHYDPHPTDDFADWTPLRVNVEVC